jgi:DNA-binding transcriptional regulator YdaS (Cro superfamily)
MRLGAWLELKGIQKGVFARKIGVTPPTITRIIAGTQNIPLSTQDAIFRETDGAVTPDDLHAAYAEKQAAQ